MIKRLKSVSGVPRLECEVMGVPIALDGLGMETPKCGQPS